MDRSVDPVVVRAREVLEPLLERRGYALTSILWPGRIWIGALRDRVALSLIALALCGGEAAAQGGALRGIAFTVDTATDGVPIDGMLSALKLEVRFARGRGRIDVLGRTTRPPVQFKWLTFARPAAVVGDYYLFDSTSFTHVRPASRTYTRYILPHTSYNYEMRREGWPFFRYDPEQPRLTNTSARGSRGEYTVFWHAELTRDTSCTGMSFGHCLIRELARGRDDVRDAPASEVGIVRWFGPTRALAGIDRRAGLIGAPIRVTAVGYWKRGENEAAAVPAIRFLLGLTEVAIDSAQLTLPRRYRERSP